MHSKAITAEKANKTEPNVKKILKQVNKKVKQILQLI